MPDKLYVITELWNWGKVIKVFSQFSQATKVFAHPWLVLHTINPSHGEITGRRLRITNLTNEMKCPTWSMQHLPNASVWFFFLSLRACPKWHTVRFLCVPDSAELRFYRAAAAGVMATYQSRAQTAGVWSPFNWDLIEQSLLRSGLGSCSVPVLCLVLEDQI